MNNFICALSGQSPIADPVCTPTGQICSRKLLLTKLSETNGTNPFLSSSTENGSTAALLDESQLIDLTTFKNDSIVLPPKVPSCNSIPSLLTTLQSEYDNLVLELYDTRRSLEETRRELSEALYQNDAAVRVIARVVLERDVARREVQTVSTELEQIQKDGSAGNGNKRRRVEGGEADVVPPTEDDDENGGDENMEDVITAEIPPVHAKALEMKWKELSSIRKKALKKNKKKGGAAAEAEKNYATFEMLEGWECTQKKNLHKASSKPGILALNGSCATGSPGVTTVVTCAKDKQLIIYDGAEDKIAFKEAIKTFVSSSCLDCFTSAETGEGLVACVGDDAILRVYHCASKDDKWSEVSTIAVLEKDQEGKIVGVCIHPTGKHVIVVTSTGNIMFFSLEEGNVKKIAVFEEKSLSEGVECTVISLHPDGLILGVGRSDGKLSIWDLKSQKLASTLEGANSSKISALDFSESGYHVAASNTDGSVSLWDLRKQKIIASLSLGDDSTDSIQSLSFCPTGKYIAYGTSSGKIAIHVVKDSDKKVLLDNTKKAGNLNGLVWGFDAHSLISCSDSDRSVKTWGMPVKDP